MRTVWDWSTPRFHRSRGYTTLYVCIIWGQGQARSLICPIMWTQGTYAVWTYIHIVLPTYVSGGDNGSTRFFSWHRSSIGCSNVTV